MIKSGENRWVYVTVIQNTISAQNRQQMPMMSTNNAASSIECPHSLVKIILKVKIYN